MKINRIKKRHSASKVRGTSAEVSPGYMAQGPEEAVAALEKRMTERLDAVEKAASDADHSTVISALTDRVTAVEQAAADADSSAAISKLADRVDAV